jgi:hypothetical protein
MAGEPRARAPPIARELSKDEETIETLKRIHTELELDLEVRWAGPPVRGRDPRMFPGRDHEVRSDTTGKEAEEAEMLGFRLLSTVASAAGLQPAASGMQHLFIQLIHLRRLCEQQPLCHSLTLRCNVSAALHGAGLSRSASGYSIAYWVLGTAGWEYCREMLKAKSATQR